MSRSTCIVFGLCLSLSLPALAHTTSNDKATTQRFLAGSAAADMEATRYLQLVPGKITGFKKGGAEETLVLESFHVIEQVMNSETFKHRVINFVNKKGQRAYESNNGLTNEQVYAFLMGGKELINGEATEGEMNFDLKRYTNYFSKVIGYTNPGKSNLIKVNSKFYRKFDVPEVTGNLVHEWIHLMGFFHGSAASHDSVPYAVGYIARDLAKKLMVEGQLR